VNVRLHKKGAKPSRKLPDGKREFAVSHAVLQSKLICHDADDA
jgi:hypothetical protein